MVAMSGVPCIRPDGEPEFNEYTAVLNGNRGEEQFVVVATARQDGKVSVAIIRTSVDGETRSYVTGYECDRENFTSLVSNWLRMWMGGYSRDEAIRSVADSYAKKIVMHYLDIEA